MMMMWSDSSKKGNDYLYELVLKKGRQNTYNSKWTSTKTIEFSSNFDPYSFGIDHLYVLRWAKDWLDSS